MRIKSIVLSMLTLLAISATTMTLTACFGDDDEPIVIPVSIYKQWQIPAAETSIPEAAKANVSAVCCDMTDHTTAKLLVKMAQNVTYEDVTYEAEKWYTLHAAIPMTVTAESETVGTLAMEKITYSYALTLNTLTLVHEVDGQPVTMNLKATSGVKSEGIIPSEAITAE